MCDTIVATPAAVAGRIMLFGKNSDRQRNEAQQVVRLPRRTYEADTLLKCTYVAIPQVSRTHAVLLSKPFWIWGAEMGANEHGVTIGNEGLQARSPAPTNDALLGMDLLRLALERAASAMEAVDVITSLLEQHGQGGNCGHLTPSHYNNGFVICDAHNAFVLETVGRDWLLERVKGVRALSNIFSVGHSVERTSVGFPTMTRDLGWTPDGGATFAEIIAAPDREHLGQARARQARATTLLQARAGTLGPSDMKAILRDHGANEEIDWDPATARTATICMHPGARADGEQRIGQTTASMVSEIRTSGAVHWVTGTSAPCISLFRPVLLDVPIPPHGPTPNGHFDDRTMWWRHERLYRRAVRGDFPQFLQDIAPERDKLEADFHTRIAAVLSSDVQERTRVIRACWEEADDAESAWSHYLPKLQPPHDEAYNQGWDEMNRLAGLEP